MRNRPVSIFVLAVSTLLAAASGAQEEHGHSGRAHGDPRNPHGMKHDFSDVGRFVEQFDDPGRVTWQKPEEVVGLMAIGQGMTIVDIGAGTGFFEPYLDAAVGPEGRVWALDVEPAMVEYLKKRVEAEGLASVRAKEIAGDDPGLEAGSVDRVIVVNTWHHVGDRASYSAKLLEALQPGGAVFVIDFEESSPHGPPPRHRLPADQVVAELSGGGLEASILDESLPYQYVVVGRAD